MKRLTRLELHQERNAGRGLAAKCPVCTGDLEANTLGAWEGDGAVCTNRLEREGGRLCGNYRVMSTKGLERSLARRAPSLLERLALAESSTHLADLWAELEVLSVSPRTRRRWVVARDVRLAQLKAGDLGTHQ